MLIIFNDTVTYKMYLNIYHYIFMRIIFSNFPTLIAGPPFPALHSSNLISIVHRETLLICFMWWIIA